LIIPKRRGKYFLGEVKAKCDDKQNSRIATTNSDTATLIDILIQSAESLISLSIEKIE